MGALFLYRMQTGHIPLWERPSFHSNLGNSLLKSWHLLQSQHQGLRCKGTFLASLPPNMVASWGREVAEHLGNKALWSPSSSFYFCTFHFPSFQKSPRGGNAFSFPFPAISLSFLPDTSYLKMELVPISLLLLLSLSSHLEFHFPKGVDRLFL